MMKASHSQLLMTAFLLAVSKAQNNDKCNNTHSVAGFENGAFNATGSVSIPGPMINESSPESTWTWSAYRGTEYRSSKSSALWTTFGLKTSPLQNLTDPSIPYTGCIIAFSGFPDSVSSRDHSNDNGSCNTMFTEACSTAITDSFRLNALQLSGEASLDQNFIGCPSLLSNTPSLSGPGAPCEGQWSSVFSSGFLTRNFSEPVNEAEPGCPLPNEGDSDAGSGAFFAWGGSTMEVDNFTLYDNALLTPVPLLMVVWGKPTGDEDVDAQSNFADVKLMCLPTNITEPGSRNLSQAQAESGAVSSRWVGLGTLGSVIIGILIGFVL